MLLIDLNTFEFEELRSFIQKVGFSSNDSASGFSKRQPVKQKINLPKLVDDSEVKNFFTIDLNNYI